MHSARVSHDPGIMVVVVDGDAHVVQASSGIDASRGFGMADKSGIEWTESTWNPTTGCDRTSPGCDRCYAMTLAKRLKAMGQPKYQRDGDPRTSGPGFALTMHEDALLIP